MKAYIFPGQGAQFVGMGWLITKNQQKQKRFFEAANGILGFAITEEMFAGTDEGLKQTKVTQPAIFLHSVILSKVLGKDFAPQMVAGHSLGEFSALVANGTLTFWRWTTISSQTRCCYAKSLRTTAWHYGSCIGLRR